MSCWKPFFLTDLFLSVRVWVLFSPSPVSHSWVCIREWKLLFGSLWLSCDVHLNDARGYFSTLKNSLTAEIVSDYLKIGQREIVSHSGVVTKLLRHHFWPLPQSFSPLCFCLYFLFNLPPFEESLYIINEPPSALGGATGPGWQLAAYRNLKKNIVTSNMRHFSPGISTAI